MRFDMYIDYYIYEFSSVPDSFKIAIRTYYSQKVPNATRSVSEGEWIDEYSTTNEEYKEVKHLLHRPPYFGSDNKVIAYIANNKNKS